MLLEERPHRLKGVRAIEGCVWVVEAVVVVADLEVKALGEALLLGEGCRVRDLCEIISDTGLVLARQAARSRTKREGH